MKTKNLLPKIKNLYILIIGLVIGLSILVGVNAQFSLISPTNGSIIDVSRGQTVTNFINGRNRTANHVTAPGDFSVISRLSANELQLMGQNPAAGKFLQATDSAGNTTRADISIISGTPGTPGAAGTGIISAIINSSGHLILTLSNNNIIDAGLVKGATGVQGPIGTAGAQGPIGLTGPQGIKGETGFLQAGTIAGQTVYRDGSQRVISQGIYNNGGTIGIGMQGQRITSDTNTALHVGGNVKINKMLEISCGLPSSNYGIKIGNGASYIYDSSCSSSGRGGRETRNEDGNTTLHIESDEGIFISAKDGTTNKSTLHLKSNGTGYILGDNFGIGTNNPTAKLEIAGQIKITGGNPGSGKVLKSDGNGLASRGDSTKQTIIVETPKYISVGNTQTRKAECNTGYHVLGGGFRRVDNGDIHLVYIMTNKPAYKTWESPLPDARECSIINQKSSSITPYCYALCQQN